MGEVWEHYFSTSRLDNDPRLHRGLAEMFALFLRRMGEPSLLDGRCPQLLVIRLLCLPTWAGACTVRIVAQGSSWRLIGKELGGEAGFEVGSLVRRENRPLSHSEAARVERLWEYLGFWSLPVYDEAEVFDGTTYLLEASQDRLYHVAHRAEPEWGDTFGEFCNLLVDLAAF